MKSEKSILQGFALLFLLDVIRVFKELRAVNVKARLLISFCALEQVSVLISEKPSMLTVKLILLLNFKLPSQWLLH